MNVNLFTPDRTLFGGLRGLDRVFDELFGEWPGSSALRSSAPGSYPAVNVGVTSDAVHVYVLAPGLDPSKLDVNIQAGALSISGARARNAANDKKRHYRQERFDGEFRRVIALPQDVNADGVDASYRNGVLHVKVPRREAAKARQIQVK
jgi:HSP20 family protein